MDSKHSTGILYAFSEGGRVAWKCYHDGRTEFFPACTREVAIRTAEHLLGVPVELQETPLTARAAGDSVAERVASGLIEQRDRLADVVHEAWITLSAVRESGANGLHRVSCESLARKLEASLRDAGRLP